MFFAVLTTGCLSALLCSAGVCFIPSAQFLLYLHGIIHYANYVLASPENVSLKSVKQKGENLVSNVPKNTCRHEEPPHFSVIR